MLKKICQLSLIIGIYLSVVSCKHPNYSDTPQIELKNFTKYYRPNSDISADSLVFELKLKDGDGDLGLNKNDAPNTESNPFYSSNGNPIYFDESDPNLKFNCLEWNKFDNSKIATNINYNNLFFEIDKKVNGNFVKLDNSCFGIRAYRFERLSPENYTGPIDVNFTYRATLDLLTDATTLADQVMILAPSDIIRFRITIRDRKQHVSNEIVTQDIKVRN